MAFDAAALTAKRASFALGSWIVRTVLLILAVSSPARALDPSRSLAQLHHTAWTIEDGAPPDVWALAQSPDGYLWLGTGAGLYRFDGVRFEQFQAANGEHLPSPNINALFAAPDGTLWIGFVSGDIARLRAGHLVTFAVGLPGAPVYQIVQTQNKTIWAALNGHTHGGLVRFVNDRWQIVGAEMGLPGGPTESVLAATDGSLWVTAAKTLLVLSPGAKRFKTVGNPIHDDDKLFEAADGQVWLSGNVESGLRCVSADTGTPGAKPIVRPDQMPAPGLASSHVIGDRDGVFWGSYQVGGIFRFSPCRSAGCGDQTSGARLEKFTLSEGLSSDLARPILEDREGNIWIGTNLGLDRFRMTNMVSVSGIPATSQHGFFIARGAGASVYVLSNDTLFRAFPGRHTEVLDRFTASPSFISSAEDGSIWAGFRTGLTRLSRGKLQPVSLPPDAAGIVEAWMQDRTGSICVSVLRNGIFCGHDGAWSKSDLHLDDVHPSPAEIVQDTHRNTWLNYDDKLARFDGRTLRAFSAADGLSIGGTEVVTPSGDSVMVGGDFGIARFDGSHFTSIRVEQIPVFSRITGIVQTERGDTWINGIMGVVRVSTKDLLAAFQHPDRRLDYVLYGLGDGLPGVAQQDSDTQTALEAEDGSLWFVTSHGVAWLDPQHQFQNLLAPPVSIEAILVNGRTYPFRNLLTLPEGVTNLQINYTALSLSIPERVRFRYQLQGVDLGWIDPGNRRTAFYTKLEPGSYQFKVIASNNDGVWNETGAAMTIVIPPTFLQSDLFKALVGLCLCGLVWALYSLRLRQMSERIRSLLEERVRERERIARELHDTLLQGVQGLVLRFQAVTEQIQKTDPARQQMESALDLADNIMEEGRDRVLNLRTQLDVDISLAFSDAARRILLGTGIDFTIIVEGKVRRLHPLVYEEVSRIVDEALLNAARHGQPETVEVVILYASREFRVHITDDGVGIDPRILADGGRSRHFGLLGMRERAAKIGAGFGISSRPHCGTEITITIPASVAYGKRLTGARRLLADRAD